MRLLITLLFSFFVMVIQAQTINFTGVLEGSQEVPPVTSTGTGTMGATYDMTTKILVVHASFANLSSNPNNAHIHQAPVGTSGGVVFGLTFCGSMASGAISGTGTLTTAQETALLNDGMYLNLHTANNGGGELRAQLIQLIDVQNNTLAGVLDGAQENPPVTTSATGVATAIYNADTGELTVGATYSDLSAVPTAAHVHKGAVGMNGDVLFGLTVCGTAASGRAAGQATLTNADDIDALINGELYVNIHNSNNPGGEVRAQLLITHTQLVGTLEGAQENPPVTTAGSGKVRAYYDHNTMEVSVNGTYENLSSPSSGAHIHQAPAGSNGGVIVGLSHSNATSGTISGGEPLSVGEATAFLSGGTYVNLHSANNPGGELRAQLGTTTTALPLEVLSFKVEKTKTANRLVWETATETDIESFEIEHQSEQKSFEKMNVVAAKGAGQAWTRYEYNLPTLTKGTHFFRLKIKENSGKTYYSDRVSLLINKWSNQIEIAINPNPFQQEMNIDFTIEQPQMMEVMIYNYAGVLVAKPYYQFTEAGQPMKINFDSKNLPVGLYYIEVKGRNFTTTQKVLKN